jgi:hypothetical protein
MATTKLFSDASEVAFTDDQLADLVRAEASILWRDHRKLEMGASAIAAPVSAFLVALAVYLLGYPPAAGMPWGAIGAGVAAAIIAIPITLGIIYSYYRFVEAPTNLYIKVNSKLANTCQLLEDEEARNAAPKLAGQIDCLDHDAGWDVEMFGVDEEGAMHLKVCFTLAVTLWNHSAAATTVSGFTLDVLWAGREFHADWLPVANYSVKRGIPRSDFDAWGYETISSPLIPFPDDVEITNRNHQSGWLRFLARRIPPRSADSATLHKDATLRLCALDRRGQAHPIYEGTWDLRPCGLIEKRATIYGLEINQ